MPSTGLSAAPQNGEDNNENVGYSSIDEEGMVYAPHISYKKRKEQDAGEEKDAWLKTDGIEYSKKEPLISELFNIKQLPSIVRTVLGDYDVTRSYIYVISKKIDTRTFIKIGMSNLGNSRQKISTRLESAQTFLIPGLENSGFKLHYVFFYRREAASTGTSFAELIERDLHKYLKLKYERAVIHMPTNRPSEWYLPDIRNYRKFIDDALEFISLQNPQPEEAYHFKKQSPRSKILVREHKEKFLKLPKPEAIIEYRKDYIALKKNDREKAKATAERELDRKGNKKYFMDKLVNNIKTRTPPLGDKFTIVDIYYHRSASDKLRKFGEYYGQIKYTKASDANKEPSEITLSFNVTIKNEIKYYSHISHILEFMHDLETDAIYGLTSNYNHYYELPIKIAKLYLNRKTNKNYKYSSSQCKWMIGRIVRDKHNNLYRAVDIKTSRNDDVRSIVYHEIHPENKMFKEPRVKKLANPTIARKLTVDYHDNITHGLIKYGIDNSENVNAPATRAKGEETYNLYDFVKFNKNYFKKDDKSDPTQYIGVVLQKKWNYARNNDTKEMEYEYQYEILFENGELWEFNTKQVDDNSTSYVTKRGIEKFLRESNLKKNAIYHLYERYGIPRPDVGAVNSALPIRELRVARSQVNTRKKKNSTRKVLKQMLSPRPRTRSQTRLGKKTGVQTRSQTRR